jgi:hypothetical protein
MTAAMGFFVRVTGAQNDVIVTGSFIKPQTSSPPLLERKATYSWGMPNHTTV